MKKSRKALVSAIEKLYADVLKELGAETEPEFLDIKHTPARVARALVNELLVGYTTTEQELLRKLRMFKTTSYRELVVQTDLPVTTMCAHHMLPFVGTASIGYLPGGYLLGLSKLYRILDFFSARLQVQERLGAQVAEFLVDKCKAQSAFVIIEAEHCCMSMRGIRRRVPTITTSIRPGPPGLPDRGLIDEFYRMVEIAKLRRL